jgi:UTP-glucose-1-phosphate uridylyltransferase
MIRNPSKYICGIFEKQLALEAKLHTKKKTHVKKHQRHHPLMISKMIVKQNQGFLSEEHIFMLEGYQKVS